MSVEFRPEAAYGKILGKTEAMVANASEFLAAHAQDRAPVGKGDASGKGIRPGHGVRLRPLKEFGNAKGKLPGKDRQVELLGHKPGQLVNLITTKDFFRFKLTTGPDKGETPDVILPGNRGVLKGAKIYRPGRLRRGIHATPIRTSKNQVRGRVVSDAPYSLFMEKGFHHKGGTVVEGRHFMQKALEEDTREAFLRGDFFPK